MHARADAELASVMLEEASVRNQVREQGMSYRIYVHDEDEEFAREYLRGLALASGRAVRRQSPVGRRWHEHMMWWAGGAMIALSVFFGLLYPLLT